MATYVHRFIRSGVVRQLHNAPVTPGSLEVAQLEQATMEPNMGYADYAADISRAEFDAHPTIYVVDARVVLYDLDDPDNQDELGDFTPVSECWAGFLDEPRVGDGTVRLGASGYGKLADRFVKHWLWADYDTDQYQPTGPDSDFPYDSDDEIEMIVGGRSIKAKVQRKTEFRQRTGRTRLQADAEATDVKLDVGHVGGLRPGMQITIEGNAGGDLMDLAEYAVAQGYRVGGHPDYGGSGACDGGEGSHVVGSHHCRNLTGTGGDALDINWTGPDEDAKLIELAGYITANYAGVLDELFHPGNDPVDHGDHLHVSFNGSAAASPAIVRTVASDWRPSNSTIKMTADLGSARQAGTRVTWNPAEVGRWASSVAGYYPGVNIGGVRFDIELPRGKNHRYTLEVARATGPDGAKTVAESLVLNRHRDDRLVDFAGNDDMVLFTVARDGDEETKNADHFVARIARIRTYGPFTTAESYETWQIVRDVGVEMGIDTSGVVHTTTNGLPFKVMQGRASDALDAQAAVEDMVWLITGGEGGPELKFRKWGDAGERVWRITDPHALGNLESLPRYDRLHLAYAHDEGFEQIVTMTADPNELTGGVRREYPQVIFQGDRPPPLALAQSFGQPIINELNRARYFGQKNFVQCEDTNFPGDAVPPTRIRPGDRAICPQEDDVNLRVASVSLNGDGTVTTTFPSSVPSLERALALRTLLLNRGVRQTRATLAGLNLRRPRKAGNLTGGWKRIETRNGEHRFDALANWSDVTEDVNGRAIFVREYDVRWRYRDQDTGLLVRDDDGDLITERTRIKLESLEDNAAQLPSRARLRNIRNPHKYEVEYRVDVISMQHKHSGFSAWTSIGSPILPDPPQPTDLVQRVDQHTIKIDFDCNDADELDGHGDEMLARGAGQFKILRFMNCANPNDPQPSERYGKIIRTRATHKQWPAPKHTAADSFTTEVYGLDSYGQVSTVARVTTGRGAPPAPVSAPGPFVFDRGGKKRIRGRLPFTYTGADADFHIHGFMIEWQVEDHDPGAGDPFERKYRRTTIAEANSPHVVIIGGLKRGERIRARYYAQATKNGHLSPPSPWSTIQTVSVTRRPRRPDSVTMRGKRTGILVRCPRPDRWNDDSTEGWDPSEVAYYVWRLLNADGTLADLGGDEIAETYDNHHFFPLTKAQAGTQAANGVITWNNYLADVEVFGWDELSDGRRTATVADHAQSLTGTAAAHTHTGGGHRHGKQHRHGHGNQHSHPHGGHSHPPGNHTHQNQAHFHTTSGGGDASELTHSSGGPHDHGGTSSALNHNHGMQHNHGGQTGTAAGHTHSIPQLTNVNSDGGGGHSHALVLNSSHSHDHTTGISAKPTSSQSGLDTLVPGPINTGSGVDTSGFQAPGDTDDDTAQTDLANENITESGDTTIELI